MCKYMAMLIFFVFLSCSFLLLLFRYDVCCVISGGRVPAAEKGGGQRAFQVQEGRAWGGDVRGGYPPHVPAVAEGSDHEGNGHHLQRVGQSPEQGLEGECLRVCARVCCTSN